MPVVAAAPGATMSRAWLWGLGGATLAMLAAVVAVVIVRHRAAPTVPRSPVIAPSREITTRSLGGGPTSVALPPEGDSSTATGSGSSTGSGSTAAAGTAAKISAMSTAGTVTLDLVGKPIGAEVIDAAGVLRGYLPLQLAVPRGGELVLTFRADGRQPVTEVVVLDRDRRIEVALRRTGGRTTGGSPSGIVTGPAPPPSVASLPLPLGVVRPPAGSGSSDLMEPT